MDFDSIAAMDPGPPRTAALASWFQGAFEDRTKAPVLVGGGAVELFTGGAYTTGDLDFVGHVSVSAKRLLENAGFQRVGRHWKHEEAQLFIEFPARSLEAGARATELDAFGKIVRVISPEDALVDRLAGWKFWKSDEHGVNAYLLYRAMGRDLERPRLEKRARAEQVEDALLEVVRFAERTAGRQPKARELREWAKRDR